MDIVVGILEKDNLFLGVSRRDDYNRIGLVGGKSDDGEKPYDAFKREVLEEVGINVLEAYLLDVREHETHNTYCYVITKYDGNFTPNEKLIEIGEGIWDFVEKEKFNFCADYNKEIIKKYYDNKQRNI